MSSLHGALLSLLAFQGGGESVPLERAFERFFEAAEPAEAEEAIAELLRLAPDFSSAFDRLRAGRTYAQDVPRGKLMRSHEIDGRRHPYMLFIPGNYTPTKTWPVRWDLHGGMGQAEWKRLDGAWSPGYAAIEEYNNDIITVVPAGWNDSMWWEFSQVRSFHGILDEIRRTWNVDEDRIVMFGSSDGAIAEWFYAFRDPDPWAAYIGFVGFPARLTNRTMRADGQMHLSNLFGQRFTLFNGVRDHIVNIHVVRQYLDVLRAVDGVEIDYHEHEDDGHDLRVTRAEEELFMGFFAGARRDPLPERLTWATERVDRFNRRFWLEILELDPRAESDPTGVLPRIYGKNVPRTPPPKLVPYGRVELERRDNTVLARTTGVRRFRLLLSPEEFDFSRPVEIELNGEVVFHGEVGASLEVLLRRAAQDGDRHALFGCELEIEVAR